MITSKKNNKKKIKINKNLKCLLCESGTLKLTYKDIYKLEKFITKRGKIIAKIRTGTCSTHQRQISESIKISRNMALI